MAERLREVPDLAPARRRRTPRRAGRRRCAAPSRRSNSARASSHAALAAPSASDQPERAGEEQPLVAGGRPSSVSAVRVARAPTRRGRARCSDRVDRAGHALIGRRAGSRRAGSCSRLASSSLRPVVLGERAALGVVAVLGRPRRGSRRAARASGRSAPRGRTARSAGRRGRTTTQAITLECVKWRRGPRTSQIPSSGSRQMRLEVLDDRQPARPQRAGDPCRAALTLAGVCTSIDFAVDVELELLGGARCRSRTGLRALVAGQPGELELVQPALAADART